MTISAELVEGVVIDAVKARIADAQGRASSEANVQQAEQALDSAQADLDAAIRAFAGFSGEVAAIERLDELRAARHRGQERVDQLERASLGPSSRTAIHCDTVRAPP